MSNSPAPLTSGTREQNDDYNRQLTVSKTSPSLLGEVSQLAWKMLPTNKSPVAEDVKKKKKRSKDTFIDFYAQDEMNALSSAALQARVSHFSV